LAERTEREQPGRRRAASAQGLAVRLDGEAEAMGIDACSAPAHQALDQGRGEIRPVTRAVEGKVRCQDLGFILAAPAQNEPEAFAVTLDLRHLTRK
jgi:hypothetical protein